MKSIVVIPARYESSRFPGKPLVDIMGKTMIERVYKQAIQSKADRVIIATDDERIEQHAQQIGAKVALTGQHPNGSSRCREALLQQKETFDILINVQGDEPFIQPQQIDNLIDAFEHPTTQIATLVKQIDKQDDLFNSDVVKVVLGQQLTNTAYKALYFSRSSIPHVRDTKVDKWLQRHHFYKHLGIYAFRADFIIEQYPSIAEGLLEKAEKLEQLGWLEAGHLIAALKTTYESINIDRPEDLNKAINYLKNHPS